MTREEAITILKDISWQMGSVKRWENIEAIDMAIEALSQPIVAKHFDIQSGHIYCSPQIAENVKVVVRCKDCTNFDHAFNYCDFLEAGVDGEDFFCAYGERKGGDDK